MNKHLVFEVVLLACIAPGAWAHRYLPDDGSHVNAAAALPIGDIDLSQVVYHYVKEDASPVWLSFEASAGMVAKVQIGVPYLDRYQDYRPAFALLGPGLPALGDMPFEVPQGYGGIVYSTEGLPSPEIFDEEFTGTRSWLFEMQEIPLPQAGLYYIVGFVPSRVPGKFWIAPGTRESFGIGDILSLPYVIYKVRTFHEVFPFGGLLAWGMLGILLVLIALLLA